MRHDVYSLRARISEAALRAKNLARRVAIRATEGGLWALRGFETPDGEEDSDKVELFGGIGVYFRPAASDRAEAIVINVGGDPDHPAIVATRDEDARKAFEANAGALEPGEMAIANAAGSAYVRITADGDIVIEAKGGAEVLVRSKSGTPVALATKADVDAIKTAFDAHTHILAISAASGSGGTGTAAPPATPAPAPSGTSVLKGE